MLRARPGLAGALLGLLAVFAFVGIRWECVIGDDFAYARMAQRLARDGELALDPWTAAAGLPQVVAGAAATRLVGPSLGVLRAVAAAWAFVAVTSTYLLLRQRGASDRRAGLLALVIWTSPLLVHLSCMFVTDVPFLALLLLSMWLLASGLDEGRAGRMVAGGLVAALAVTARQFGAIVVVGLAAAWLADADRRRRLPLYAAGAAPPLAAAVVVLAVTLAHPTAGMTMVLQGAAQQTPWSTVRDAAWRAGVVPQYLAGLLLLPLLPALVSDVRRLVAGRPARLAGVAATVALVAASYVRGYLSLGPMPFLPWYLDDLVAPAGRLAGSLVGAVGVLGGGALVVSLAARLPAAVRGRRPSTWFLMGTAAGFCLQLGSFYKLGDKYLVVLVPFVAVALRGLRPGRAGLVLALVAAAAGALWTRATLDRAAARWAACEQVVRQGVDPAEVYGDFAWAAYHGAVDHYLAQAGADERWEIEVFRWLERRQARARWVVVDRSALTEYAGEAVPFRTALLDEDAAVVTGPR